MGVNLHQQTDSKLELSATVANSLTTFTTSAGESLINVKGYQRICLTLTNNGAAQALTNFQLLAASTVGGTHCVIVDKDTTETWKFGTATLAAAGTSRTEIVDLHGAQEISFKGLVGASTSACSLKISGVKGNFH